MLELNVTEKELYDAGSNTFLKIPSCTLTLEHSLISLSKWESKWQIPYLNGLNKTPEQDSDYIRCMVIGPIKDDRIFGQLSPEELYTIQTYMQAPMTATTFSPPKKNAPKAKKEVMTSEVLYAHMCAHRIPMECQKWHLNRLLTLIKVCGLQNEPPEKMSKKQSALWAAEQNAARKAKYGTRG